MTRSTTRIESMGSVWHFDDGARTYLRMPKHEGPRASPPGEDWGGPGAGVMQDLTWHPFERYEETDWHRTGWVVHADGARSLVTRRRLIIHLPDGGIVSAPLVPCCERCE